MPCLRPALTLIMWRCSKEIPETQQDMVPGPPAPGSPAGAAAGPADLHRSLTFHTWVGCSASVCLLKHLSSNQLPVRKDAGTRNDPKLNPPSGFIPKQLPTPENLVSTVRREVRPFYHGHQLGGGGGAGDTALQLMNTNQYVQQLSHRTLRKSERQKEEGVFTWHQQTEHSRARTLCAPRLSVLHARFSPSIDSEPTSAVGASPDLSISEWHHGTPLPSLPHKLTPLAAHPCTTEQPEAAVSLPLSSLLASTGFSRLPAPAGLHWEREE